MTGFCFVDEHQAEYRITDLCRVAGVSRSGFYAWRHRAPSDRDHADAELLVEIRAIHAASRGTYGAPRVRGQLRRQGRHVSRKRVARLMAADGLVGAHSRRRWRRGRPPAMVPAPDLLNRDFTADWALTGSYGSVGDAFDNAAMETFWATLKREIRHIWGPWGTLTRSELRTILFDYIEVFYNRQRHQTGLDHRTPAEAYHPAPAA